MDDSVRYEDAVQIRKYVPADPHFLLLTYAGFVNAGATDVYGAVAFLVDNKTRIMYHYAVCSYVCNAGAGIMAEILGRVSPQTSLIDGVYHFQTLGNTAPVPGASDWSIMLDFIIANGYKYTWFSPTNQAIYDFAQDINDNPVLQPWFRNLGAQGVWLARYEFIKPIRKVISTVTRSYKYAPYEYVYPSNAELDLLNENEETSDLITDTTGQEDFSDFAKATGLTATQFNNLFVNVPRNCRVDTSVTDWLWNNYSDSQLQVIVFRVNIPLNSISYSSFGLDAGISLVNTLVVYPIHNFVQYDELPPVDELSVKHAYDLVKQKFAGSFRGFDVQNNPATATIVYHYQYVPANLLNYMFGRITYIQYLKGVGGG